MACMKTYGHGNGVAHGGVDHVERGVERGVEGVVGAQAGAQDCEGQVTKGGGSNKKVMQSLVRCRAVHVPPLGVCCSLSCCNHAGPGATAWDCALQLLSSPAITLIRLRTPNVVAVQVDGVLPEAADQCTAATFLSKYSKY